MLRFKSFLILGLLVLTTSLSAQSKREKSLLWKVEKQGYNTSYLFGTIHVKDERVFHFNDSLFSKLDEVDVLVTELDLSTESILAMVEGMKLPEGKTLQDVMKPKQYERLRDFAEEHVALNFSQLEKFKPFMVLMLTMQKEIPNNTSEAVDMYLYNYAVKIGKKTKALETLDEQLEALDALSIEKIIKSIDEYESEKGISYEDMILAYQNSDIQAMNELTKLEEAKNEKFMKAIFDKRNKVMAKRIPLMMKESSTFFAIGAGHLAGTKGVLSKLENDGFKITPVVAGKSLPLDISDPKQHDDLFGSKFSVDFPSDFTHKEQLTAGMKVHIYSSNHVDDSSPNKLFNLIYYDLPLDVSALGEDELQAFFTAFEQGIIKTMNGEIISKKEVSIINGKAEDILINLANQSEVAMRVIIQKNYSLILQVVAEGKINKVEVDNYYKSLKIN